jgi:hypothetical protein
MLREHTPRDILILERMYCIMNKQKVHLIGFLYWNWTFCLFLSSICAKMNKMQGGKQIGKDGYQGPVYPKDAAGQPSCAYEGKVHSGPLY